MYCVCAHSIYIYIYIYIYIVAQRHGLVCILSIATINHHRDHLREMGGAPRNPAPRNRFLDGNCQTTRLPLHRCVGWKNVSQSADPS